MFKLSKPFIIDFEGIDGTFKYTNACKLQDYIEDTYTSNVIVISFPNYDGESSYLLREYFKENINKQPLSPKMVSTLFMLDMYDVYYKQLKEYYDKNYIMIFDRFWYSNIYYQGASYALKAGDREAKLNIYSYEKLYKDFEREIYELNESEFKLPKANLIYTMIHNNIDSKSIIEQRRVVDKSHNDEINEDKYTYLDNVNNFLKAFPFSYGATDFRQYDIELDNIDKTCKTEDQIFNMIRQIFDSNLAHFLKEG